MGAVADRLDYSLLGRCVTFQEAVATYRRGNEILLEYLREQPDLIRLTLDCTWEEGMQVRRAIHQASFGFTTMLYSQDGTIHLWLFQLVPMSEAA